MDQDVWPMAGDRRQFPRETGSLWWTCQVANDRFAVLVAPVRFKPKGTLQYTVWDRERAVRGPCNLIGQGYGDGSYSVAECERMLAQFTAGELEVSHRNNVPIFQRVPARHPSG